jgi:perosamine synthetase
MSKKLWRVGQKELDYIKDALESGMTGAMNQRLEREFVHKFGVKYAIGVNSGTSALHCCLAASGVGKGDEVIVPPLTFGSPAFAALYLGALPVFADVDEHTFTIDPEEVRQKITPRTKAIIAVALYGLSAEMKPIMEIAREHDIVVVEDCAECFLGWYKGRLAGTIGDMGIFSFERSKHITCGNGGMIITSDEKFAETARKFSIMGYSTLRADAHGSKPSKDVIQSPDFDRHLMISPNYRLPEVCAAMALAQLERVDEFIERRIKIAELYADAIEGSDWLVPQKTPPDFVNSYWTYVLRLDTQQNRVTWQQFRKTFIEMGGDPFYAAWKPTYLEPALMGMEFVDNNIKYEKGLCPVTERIQPELIQLKTNYESIEEGGSQATVLKKTIKVLESD